ncbi:MAG: universal stress protein [Candidatus Dadabacteria bacterium]|nr:MAG: universal stress protein [Candidatus Dadabacteria bacterium]
MKFENILVTTDLSEESRAAFSAAKSIAQAFNSKVNLLAVIEDPAQAAMMYALDYPIIETNDIRSQLMQKVKEDLENLIKEHFEGVNCEPVVRETVLPVYSEIVKASEDLKADLLVIATHGKAGLRKLLIGSVAEKVVRHAPCPVLTVPSNKEDKKGH